MPFGETARECCGVFGVHAMSNIQIAKVIYNGLVALQHRGQEAAGISVFDGKDIRTHRGLGTANEALPEKALQPLFGHTGIGHVRYSTTGIPSLDNAQPFFLPAPKVQIALAFNGNLLNYEELKEKLEGRGHIFTTTADTEVIAHLFAREVRDSDDLFEVVKRVMAQLQGSYSMLFLTDRGELIAARDPYGFKPLVMGQTDEFWVVASEKPALDACAATFVRSIEPGEIVLFNGKPESRRPFISDRKARCMFEYVYFSRPDSAFDGISVYTSRIRMGEALAKLYPVKADVVIPVPESGRTAALGYSRASGIPLAEGLMKNRYVHRTFIQPGQRSREAAVKLKLNPIREVLEGKKVVMVDDSIVRGTTTRQIVQLVKSAGATEVHLRITCPPIIAPCYMGVDFPTSQELVAASLSVGEIGKLLGTDSLGYLTLDALEKSIGLGETELCLACLTSKYPIEPKRKLQEFLR